MRLFFCCCLLLLGALPGPAAPAAEGNWLARLNTALENKEVYRQRRWRVINELTREYNQHPANDRARFALGLRIYEQYRSFKYDSAFAYARRLQQLATAVRDPRLLETAKLNLAFIHLSAGMFTETFDLLRSINPALLDSASRQQYYFQKARSYSDLADYNPNSYYRPTYTNQAIACLDTALRYSHPDTYERLEVLGFRALKENDLQASGAYYVQMLALPNLSQHQFAITASTLAWVYELTGKTDAAFELLLRASIADAESATTETIALFKVSDFCYRRSDLKDAYVFINQAREDAVFYNARLRQIQIGSIYSTIEGRRVSIIEQQRKSLTVYAIATTALILFVIAFAVIIFRQLKRLQRADALISTINQELQAKNEHLNTFNQRLSTLNQTLHEANRIKDEYVGYYFNVSSEYIDKIERFRQALDKTLVSKQYNSTQKLVDSINIKRERAELFRGFDVIFLKLFPNFVADFNALMREEEQIVLGEDQLLNTELRIFALIRLGIDDSERISRILGYTISTIYTYKTRVKKKSNYPSDEFENRVRAIEVA